MTDENRAAQNELSLVTSLHVAGARGGQDESVEWLVKRFSPLLLASARYRMGRALLALHDPEDIVNDVWVRVLPRLPELSARDGRYTPVLVKYLSQTLLFRINQLLEKHIKGKPQQVRPQREADEFVDPVDQLAAETRGVVTRLVKKERHEVVAETLAAMDNGERELILLRGVEGRPYKEISVLLKGDPKILAVQYQRALEKLRNRLPGSVFEELKDEAG